jgi:RNA polymerase sigma-70 factor (ECF subfamily)
MAAARQAEAAPRENRLRAFIRPDCDGLPPARIHDGYMASSSFAIDVPASLLARARAGDRAAFEQIYRWFERPVFTLALRICGTRNEADDVLQETMLKLWSGIDGFRGDGGSPFWGWLRQVAVNEALQRLRRERRLALELDGTDCDNLTEDHAPPPPAAADAVLLQRALGGLPAATRSVLWLYHGEGYTHEEIAVAMQRSVSFSKSQLARGIRRLRVLLQVAAPADPPHTCKQEQAHA